MEIRILSEKAGRLQDTLIEQNQRIRAIAEIELEDSIRNILQALAALGTSEEDIRWLSGQEYRNEEVDAFFLASLLLFGMPREELERLLQEPGITYEALQAALTEKDSSDTEVMEILQHMVNEGNSSRKEFSSLVAEIRNEISRKKTDSDITPEMRSSYDLMKKIVGNAHLSEDSPTYEEAARMVEAMKREVEALVKQQAVLSAEMEKKEKSLIQYRREILHIRRLYKELAEQNELLKNKSCKKNRGLFRRQMEEEKTALLPKRLLAKTVEELTSLVVHDEFFTDEQVRFICSVINEGHLPLPELKDIADPTLSVQRMKYLCEAYYKQRGISKEAEEETAELKDPASGKKQEKAAVSEPVSFASKEKALLKTIQKNDVKIHVEMEDSTGSAASSAVRIRALAERALSGKAR